MTQVTPADGRKRKDLCCSLEKIHMQTGREAVDQYDLDTHLREHAPKVVERVDM